jgi:hypothetical protein
VNIPNVENAFVEERKITLYLLSDTSVDGAPKAAFFRQFGFAVDEPNHLADALVRHAQCNEVLRTETTPFGTRYVVDGPLVCPDGRTPWIRSVWQVYPPGSPPRMITAHPLSRRPDSV